MAGSPGSSGSAGSAGSARPRLPAHWRGAAAGALGVAALALAGCGTEVAPAAQGSGVTGPASASATASQPAPASQPVPARQPLCASQAAVSQVAITQLPYPLPVRPVGPPPIARPVASAQAAVSAQPAASARPAVSARPAASGQSVPPIQPRDTPSPRPPIVKAITSLPRVRALARAVCGLPGFPRVPLPCPPRFPGSYQLTFTAAGRQFPTVTVENSGCQAVTGAGAVRTAAGQKAFWALLTEAAGPPVRWPVGHLPGAPAGPPGCAPPSTQAPPGAPGTCPGPARPGSM